MFLISTFKCWKKAFFHQSVTIEYVKFTIFFDRFFKGFFSPFFLVRMGTENLPRVPRCITTNIRNNRWSPWRSTYNRKYNLPPFTQGENYDNERNGNKKGIVNVDCRDSRNIWQIEMSKMKSVSPAWSQAVINSVKWYEVSANSMLLGGVSQSLFQWQLTKISDKSADNQSEARISVAYYKNCHFSLMASFVKRPPGLAHPHPNLLDISHFPFLINNIYFFHRCSYHHVWPFFFHSYIPSSLILLTLFERMGSFFRYCQNKRVSVSKLITFLIPYWIVRKCLLTCFSHFYALTKAKLMPQ